MAEATLGMSSLDRLRELKEETERRQAGGKRRVVDLPIGEVHPDPRQVRSDFVADVLSAEDQEDLEGLARNIAAIGIHNPIHVRPDPDGGYVIISGERRWRAAGIAGLETVPCLVAAGAEHDTGRNTLTQLSENLQRSNLKLLDVANALKRCLDETGLGQAELAKELGKSKSWVSKYLALLKAEGPFRAALDEGLLGNPETARMFGRLDSKQQERLLRRARKTSDPISHLEVLRLDRGNRPPGADPASAPSLAAREYEDQAVRPRRVNEEPMFDLHLSARQIRELVRRLGGEPPTDDGSLVADLLALLS
ncbi:MAG: ParB/RepB/Spo0J family partition protein [Holophagales bacterium]|nr:MAG: ParB/RepB/Spo0J family partition protein [Holophagales bacterium]